jgi:hypothetical protein
MQHCRPVSAPWCRPAACYCCAAACHTTHHDRAAGNWKTIEGEFNAIMAVVLPCRSDRSDSVCSAHLSYHLFVNNEPFSLSSDSLSIISFREPGPCALCTHCQRLHPPHHGLDDALPFEDDVFQSLDQGLAPFAHIADGCIHLIMVRKCSAAQYLRFLASIPRNGVIPEDFPYVDTVDATAVRVQPIGEFSVTVQVSLQWRHWAAASTCMLHEPGSRHQTSCTSVGLLRDPAEAVFLTGGHHAAVCMQTGKESSWSVDGELLQNNHISAKVYRGLIDVFARGIEYTAN